MNELLLEIKDLKAHFYTSAGIVKAVDGLSFDIRKGEVFGLVGESGSGKTMAALSILKLIYTPGKIVSGEILFNGTDLAKADPDTLRRIRGSRISMVFQEPASAFNPVFTVGYQIAESVIIHRRLKRADAEGLALDYLKKAHIAEPERIFHAYPHQLSGGTRQRAMIAMALVNSPELLILDEPTTALDVTIQAQILELLKEVIDKNNMSALFISHDFGVIADMCDRVGVMYKGRIVETGGVHEVLNNPRDRYTIELIESVKALGLAEFFVPGTSYRE